MRRHEEQLPAFSVPSLVEVTPKRYRKFSTLKRTIVASKVHQHSTRTPSRPLPSPTPFPRSILERLEFPIVNHGLKSIVECPYSFPWFRLGSIPSPRYSDSEKPIRQFRPFPPRCYEGRGALCFSPCMILPGLPPSTASQLDCFLLKLVLPLSIFQCLLKSQLTKKLPFSFTFPVAVTFHDLTRHTLSIMRSHFNPTKNPPNNAPRVIVPPATAHFIPLAPPHLKLSAAPPTTFPDPFPSPPPPFPPSTQPHTLNNDDGQTKNREFQKGRRSSSQGRRRRC